MLAGDLAKSLAALVGIALVASCSWSHGGHAGNARDIPCMSAGECAWSGNPCVIPVCSENRCTSEPAPEGLVPEGQIGGDCRESYCDGRGHLLERAKEDDPPLDDTDPCSEPACSGMQVAHTPTDVGTPCGQDGLCNGKGACGVCMPGVKQCSGNAVASCDDSGQWAAPADCPSATPICADATCLGVAEIAVGDAHACARLSDGGVRCWGDDSLGQLGDRAPLSPLVGAAGVAQVAFGRGHACARLTDATVVCWGENEYGQLGDGTGDPRSSPTPIPKLSGVAQIAAGAYHTCARLADGTVKCWGDDDQGQLGDDATAKPKIALPDSAATLGAGSPRAVSSLAHATSLAIGYSRSCSISGGSLLCWGEPYPSLAGLLAAKPAQPPARAVQPQVAPVSRRAPSGPSTAPRPSTATGRAPAPRAPRPSPPSPAPKPAPIKAIGKSSPVAVKDLKDVADVHAGTAHSCARLTDGTVECWGSNQFGQLGDGSKSEHAGPTKVKNLVGVVELAAGSDHTCARLADGSVRCWGRNTAGQLGDGSTADKNVPVQVTGIVGAAQLSVGGAHACARLATGGVMCWGAGARTPSGINW